MVCGEGCVAREAAVSKEEAVSDYHDKIMHVHYRRSAEKLMFADARETNAYKEGHRDARHAAAEIATEADSEIAKLRCEIQDLTAQLEEETELRQGAETTIEKHKATIERLGEALHNLNSAVRQLIDEGYVSPAKKIFINGSGAYMTIGNIKAEVPPWKIINAAEECVSDEIQDGSRQAGM
jgi:hypothetical protein